MKQRQSNALTSVSRIVRIQTQAEVLEKSLTLFDGVSLASSAPGLKPPSLEDISESNGLLEVLRYFWPCSDTQISEMAFAESTFTGNINSPRLYIM